MDKMVVVTFDTEQQAYDGTRVLKELHGEGSITLYASAVIAKDAGGKVSVKQAADQGPLGTGVGLVTGSLLGLLGGPVGFALGAGYGALAGSLYDWGVAIVGGDFLDEATRSLEPGKAAVVAEIDEEWVTPLDSRMEAVGGTVIRRARGDVVDAQRQRDVAAIEAEVAALEAEQAKADAETRAKLQAKIDTAKARLHSTQERARAWAETIRRETEAKRAAQQEQAAKLGQALRHTREALTP